MDRIERLYRRLADAVGARPAEAGEGALCIADIYQHLVPYRAVRGELGFAELKEYEDTLLRLLAGEGGYLSLDQPEPTDEFRRELASPNPLLGIYRDYSAATVRLNRAVDPVRSAPSAAARAAPPAPPAPREPSAPRPGQAAAPPAPAQRPPARPSPAAASVAAPPPAPRPPVGTVCAFCSAPLPQQAEVRFCPFCGNNRVPIPCVGCSTVIEPGWSFCVRCGMRRTGSGGAGPEPVPPRRQPGRP